MLNALRKFRVKRNQSMEITFLGYQKKLLADFKKLDPQQLLFFSAWCCDHLFNQYKGEIDERISSGVRQFVAECLNEIWNIVDNPSGIKKTVISNLLNNIKEMDIENELSPDETEDIAITKIVECIENTLRFALEKDQVMAVANAFLPIDVIDSILVNQYGIDTTDPDANINHELFQKEFIAQDKLIHYLKEGNKPVSTEKNIFR